MFLFLLLFVQPAVSINNGSSTKHKIKYSDRKCMKDLSAIAKLLERLHEVGTKRDKAKNRELHMDQYCLLVLM
jgi:hypothetical protein